MKHISIAFLAPAILCFLFAFNAQAADSYPEKAGEKLATGVANIVTGVGEIPKNMMISSQKKGTVYGVTAGFFVGIVQTVGRTLSGVFDVVTFVIPTTSLAQPTYIWDDFNRETTYSAWRMR
ncbi:exosortase system-associated protein, TIGR04073 family [Nitrosomonas sp. HPC101]|uniref:exosortase system-associated protein, TIGR04073 family n=1 Tax=Nitrosomonas sp. HPC101 TaxID=1658667 RepID=UPI0013719EAA|nr:exosortase system-associated protein, TIGR04073 family [Nitrosomonas sp. HPC101]MXS85631.1 exosortase system-associated protein, TIGR04073 family [Nitrosomonas sp. HPC101]